MQTKAHQPKVYIYTMKIGNLEVKGGGKEMMKKKGTEKGKKKIAENTLKSVCSLCKVFPRQDLSCLLISVSGPFKNSLD